MPSEAYQNLVTMLSAGRVTPELPLDQARAGWDAMENMLPGADAVTIDDGVLGGRPARWLTAGDGGRKVGVHLHGGGYVIGSSKSHTPFGSHLAAALGGRVVIPDYRLAPEHTAPAAIEDALSVYRELLDDGVSPADVVLTGDSAGGGLALALAIQLRDTGMPLPGSVSMISPWADATGDYPSMRTKLDEDIILSPELLAYWGGLYAGGLPLDDTRVSPALGDLAGLPPLHIQVGTREVLLGDATQLADRASAAGVDVRLEVCDDMIHIWPVLGAGVVPEAQDAIERMAGFASSRA